MTEVVDREAARMKAALDYGYALARDAGREEPTVRDAVWELLVEAADTLKRLPDHELRWFRQGERSNWPQIVRQFADEFATAVARGGAWDEVRVSLGPPTAGAISRLDEVMTWLGHAAGKNPRRDVGVLFATACGVPIRVVRRRYGCHRNTIYDIRDRGLARICAWLRERMRAAA